jgi:hypothetical protein
MKITIKLHPTRGLCIIGFKNDGTAVSLLEGVDPRVHDINIYGDNLHLNTMESLTEKPIKEQEELFEQFHN